MEELERSRASQRDALQRRVFMKKVSFRISLLLVAIAFIAAACGSSAATSTSSPASTPQATQTMTMMHLPAYAQNMKTLITSPASGTKVTSNSVTLSVQASAYTT